MASVLGGFFIRIKSSVSRVGRFLLSTNPPIGQALAANAVAINRNKINIDYKLSEADLLLGKYILVQFGKDKYFVITVK